METAVRNNTYFVRAPHSEEQCMKLLDQVNKKGDKYLSQFKYGCMSGDHASYAFIEAPSEDAARKLLLKELQADAKIEQVNTFTAKQIEELHKTYH
jgi:glucuronate isomerase